MIPISMHSFYLQNVELDMRISQPQWTILGFLVRGLEHIMQLKILIVAYLCVTIHHTVNIGIMMDIIAALYSQVRIHKPHMLAEVIDMVRNTVIFQVKKCCIL